MKKSFNDLAVVMSDEEYFADQAYNFSTLSAFEKKGFLVVRDGVIDEEKKSKSLTFGRAVDCLLTQGRLAFETQYYKMGMITLTEKYAEAINLVAINCEEGNLEDIPDNKLIECLDTACFYKNWKNETRIKNFVDKCSSVYKDIKASLGKTPLSEDDYDNAIKCAEALQEKYPEYLLKPNDFDDCENLFQVVLKTNIKGLDFKCKFDVLHIDHKNKRIFPIDIKTTGMPEWEFYRSFVKWNYHLQAKLYMAILKDVISRDEYFKDFYVEDFRFLVINSELQTPLEWVYLSSQVRIRQTTGRYSQIELNSPIDLAIKLDKYIKSEAKVPDDIFLQSPNSLDYWMTKIGFQ